MDRSKLEAAVQQKKSTRQIASEFGMGQTTVCYWLKKYNLKTARKSGKSKQSTTAQYHVCIWCGKQIPVQGKYCNNMCRANSAAVQLGYKWEAGDLTVLTETQRKTGMFCGSLRRYVFIRNDYKCCKCSWTSNVLKSGLPPLELSHKDGDYSNNRFSNIELLCPNCHAVETRLNPIRTGNGRWSNGVDTRNYISVIT